MTTRSRPSGASATVLASVAILLWSLLAWLGQRLSSVPPLLLVGASLAIGGLVGVVRWRLWRVPPRTFFVGVGGLLGYHLLLFVAFRLAPAVEANLINYLWPLLIVVLSPLFLPGHRLRPHHVLGAALGLAGAATVVTGGRLDLDPAYLAGYGSAAAAAITWASYSLATKRLPPFPSAAVGGFCLASGALALLLHALVEPRYVPTPADWIGLVALGIGPMGTAFYVWDAALKRGDPRRIGALAYATPLASTLVLVVAGDQPLTGAAIAALVLIVAGAWIGNRDRP